LTEPAALIIRAMTERDLQGFVIELARWMGYSLIYHSWTSIHSPGGFPDLVLCRPTDGKLLFVELKREVGKVTVTQQLWLDGLRACGSAAYVLRPSDWYSGHIEELLQ